MQEWPIHLWTGLFEFCVMVLLRHSLATLKNLTALPKEVFCPEQITLSMSSSSPSCRSRHYSGHAFPSHTFSRLPSAPATLRWWRDFWKVSSINYALITPLLLSAMVKVEERPWHPRSHDMCQTYTADSMISWSCLIVSIQISAVNLSLWPFLTAAAKIYTQ